MHRLKAATALVKKPLKIMMGRQDVREGWELRRLVHPTAKKMGRGNKKAVGSELGRQKTRRQSEKNPGNATT